VTILNPNGDSGMFTSSLTPEKYNVADINDADISGFTSTVEAGADNKVSFELKASC